MKRIALLLAFFVGCSLLTAQSYYISFTGTGASTTVNSVKVENLTSGQIAYLSAGDVLHLSTITGIPEVNNIKSSGLKVYPNPMEQPLLPG